jgi:hypothetical protein
MSWNHFALGGQEEDEIDCLAMQIRGPLGKRGKI